MFVVVENTGVFGKQVKRENATRILYIINRDLKKRGREGEMTTAVVKILFLVSILCFRLTINFSCDFVRDSRTVNGKRFSLEGKQRLSNFVV